MNDITLLSPISMTSKEVADLTGKRHADVLRDIDNLLESLSADLRLGFKTSTYRDASGKENRQFEMDRDSSICLVSGYDANARMKIIKRWQALESGEAAPAFKIADPTLALAVQVAIEVDALKQQTAAMLAQQASLVSQQATLDRKTEVLESRVQSVELQHRQGVPNGYLSKKNALHLYGEALSADIFHLAMAKREVPIKNYIHRGEEGYEVATFAYLETEIQAAVDFLIADAEQVTPQMCASPMLGGKRFRYVKDVPLVDAIPQQDQTIQ